MKNLFISILCFYGTTLLAQEKESVNPKNYTVAMDSLLRFVKKDQIKTGLLYDRVANFANLLDFNNEKNSKTSSYWHYIQALSEVHRSSLDPKNTLQNEVIEDLRHKNDNVLNIAYINTSIDYIDQGTPEQPNLLFYDGFFHNVEGKNPFKQKQVTVVAALAETVFYRDIKIRLNPDMIYQDDSNPIKNLTATINGTTIRLVSNYENLLEPTNITLNGNEKEIVFYIDFKDNTKMQTNTSISVSLQKNPTSPPTSFPLEENFVNNLGIDSNSPENTIPFQGYNETAPIKGVLEYRTYYNTVTNDGSAKSKINKPVIVLDGFDPGDKRKIYQGSNGYDRDHSSLYELMTYDPDNDPFNNNNKNFVKDILRPQGFDVTLVNFPNGADFIERNAMAVVALLKRENAKLALNGSTEKITLIGPSMGGLISRYALAYMEKNGIPNNVNLWVSFDSPHLGANIPISTQAQMIFLGTIAESQEAIAKYKTNLQSPAARQMLIEQVDNYPNPTSLWSFNSKNNNHPFRQQFLQNQITNSATNSNGFPSTIRKIALINGTTNGTKTHTESLTTYDIAVFGDFNLKAFYNVDRNLATPGNWVTSFEGRFTKKILCSIPFTNMTYFCGLIITDASRNDLNLNPRGCMDVVPGGTFDTVGIIKKSIDDDPAIQENRVENRAYVPNHAFIPTVSSLAFKNPNFDWSSPLNRNLVCDPANTEIPFDSYFAPSKNEEHVALTNESVQWLLQEIKGIHQAPWFSIGSNELSGSEVICINQSTTYSFGDVCKIPSQVVTWTVTPNAQIITPNNYSVIIKGITNGPATITATFQNGQTFTKEIWIGKPIFTVTETPVVSSWELYINNPTSSNFQSQGITSVTWTKLAGTGTVTGYGYYGDVDGSPTHAWSITLKITLTNDCGSTEYINTYDNPDADHNPHTERIFTISPNPSNTKVNITLKDQNLKPITTSTISAELFDMMGQPRNKVEVINNIASIDVSGLPKGIYVLKINIDGVIESHQVGVQ